jgi:hypothetical protein
LEIVADTVLDPAKTCGRVMITTSGVTVDVRRARVVGSGGDPKSCRGVGVTAAGVSGVTLKNLTVRGFETGLRVENGRGWTVIIIRAPNGDLFLAESRANRVRYSATPAASPRSRKSSPPA